MHRNSHSVVRLILIAAGIGLLTVVGSTSIRSANADDGPAFDRAACVIAQAVESPGPRDAPGITLAKGNEALRAGRAAEAIEAYEESEQLARASGMKSAALFAASNAARAAIDSEEPKRVEARLVAIEAELNRSKGSDDLSLRAQVTPHLAESWAALARVTHDVQAATQQMRAAALFVVAEQIAEELGDERRIAQALGGRGRVYLDVSRLKDARVLTRRALLAADRSAAHDSLFRLHAQLTQIEKSAGDSDAALVAARRAVAALSLARTNPRSVLSSKGSQFEDVVEPIYFELVDLLLKRAKEAEGHPHQALLAEARSTLENLKAEEVRDYFEDACLAAQAKVTPDEIPGAVVFYPVVLSDRLELIVGREGRLALHTVPIGRDEIEDLFTDLRRRLPDRTFRAYQKSATVLYDHLIRPIEASLKDADVLVAVPSGGLRQIPLGVLYDDRKKAHLIEKIAVATTPGLTLTDPRPLPIDAVQALAAGVSEAVQGYAPLPSVTAEIETVSTTFPSIVLLDSEFDASRFENAIEKNPIGIVHIASHGEFRADASESFVLTHSGQISMNRLSSVVARTRLRTEEPLEMLVLSACETAVGDNRAALGLAGVALQAGARSAVATLWSVNDQAAGELIQTFYAEIGSGRSRAAALRAAQRSLIADPRFSHPANWAAFVLISSWL